MRFTLDGDLFDLTPELVRARLQGHVPETIRDYWVEIDGTRWPVKQVISLATDVRERRRFQSQSARRWLGNLGFPIGSGQQVIPRTARPVGPGPGADKLRSRAEPQQRDLVLVGCVKSKRDSGAPAKDLYTSDYFVKMRTYAEATGLPWFILSAEHGLVRPDDWLEPYERYLPDTSRDYRRAWGQKVAAQLEEAVGSLAGLVVDVHAGAVYVESAGDALQQHGAQVIDLVIALPAPGELEGAPAGDPAPVAINSRSTCPFGRSDSRSSSQLSLNSRLPWRPSPLLAVVPMSVVGPGPGQAAELVAQVPPF